jgi:hypothetical protein
MKGSKVSKNYFLLRKISWSKMSGLDGAISKVFLFDADKRRFLRCIMI